LVFGGVIGALMGVLAGWLYFNANAEVDQEGEAELEMPSPATALQLGLGLLGVLRQIAEQ
jgi:hypothetical protein